MEIHEPYCDLVRMSHVRGSDATWGMRSMSRHHKATPSREWERIRQRAMLAGRASLHQLRQARSVGGPPHCPSV